MIKIARTIQELKTALKPYKEYGADIGFVPTMGALHAGHLALVSRSKRENEVTVCSIFVNPTQFNDPADLERYPRTLEQDKEELISVNCDILFAPSVSEVYPDKNEKWYFELGILEQVFEGACRPGHYQGVTQVVKRLFDCVEPARAYFGQKDYQQVQVIRYMIEKLSIPVELICCDTVREKDGLAMSSRNVHLSADERKAALTLSKALFFAKERLLKEDDVESVLKEACLILEREPLVQVEYFSLTDSSLQETSVLKNAVLITAAKVGQTRLIDNIILD